MFVPPPPAGSLVKEAYTHDHILIKVFTLFLEILFNFIIGLASITEPTRETIALMTITIFVISAIIIAIASAVIVAIDICTNERPIHKNKALWLFTLSKVFTGFGAVSYYIGDNLRNIITEYSVELDCDAACTENVEIVAVYFLFIALTTFVFLPTIFCKITKAFDDTYDIHQIRKDLYKEYSVQYLVFHMVALVLDFDAVYTGVWEYAFVDVVNCDTEEIIGSSACIITGWITWSIYAITFAYYSTNIKGIKFCKYQGSQYRCLTGLYYATLILFFATFFPTHILADNIEPLSCGCTNIGNVSFTLLTCEERPGVIQTRLAFYFYGMVLLFLQGIFGTVIKTW